MTNKISHHLYLFLISVSSYTSFFRKKDTLDGVVLVYQLHLFKKKYLQETNHLLLPYYVNLIVVTRALLSHVDTSLAIFDDYSVSLSVGLVYTEKYENSLPILNKVNTS